jgi:NAD(P)-dependent dehydrogenase (short-subunit alcohol dehydrogenase family)
VRAEGGGAPVATLRCDFSSMASIREASAEAGARFPRIHVLVANAGGVSPVRRVTVDGLEQIFAVNHLGYFLMVNLLLGSLKAAAPSRVVVVASAAHLRARLDFDDLQLTRNWEVSRAYSRSKLANVLFAQELARRLQGSGVTVNSLHPGASATRIWSDATVWLKPVLAVARWFMLTPEQGAEGIVHLAASPELSGKTGGYYDRTRQASPSRWAEDPELGRRLWEASEKLTGLA